MRLYGLHASVLAVGIAAQTEAATASDSGALDPLQTAKWATRLFQDQNSTTTPETLQPLVDGFIPEWLQGSLVRVGPAVWRLPKRSALHSFDGLAKVSRWSFAGGANQTGAAFTDRFVESDVYHASIQDDSYPRGVTFGPFEPPFSPFQAKVGDDNNNVNVWTADGGRVFALTDGATIIELDAQSLKTIGHMNSTGPLAGGASSCAHGLTDISAGAIAAGPTMLNFMSVPDGASGKLNVSAFRVGSLNSSSQTGPTRDLVGFGTVQFPISDWPYMHSFARTASHFVLTAFPAVLDFVALGLGKPLTECIQWRGDDAGQDDAGRMQKSPGISSADKSSAAVPTRFAVFAIPPPGSEKIDTQPLAVIEDLPAFFSWHNVNTFESSGSKGKIRNQPNPDSAEPFSLAEHPTIVVDMVAHPKFGPDIIADKSFAWLKNSAEPEAYNSTFPWSGSLRRVIINVNNSSSTFMDLPLVDAAGNEYKVELPRIRSDRAGLPYCFVYASSNYAGNSTWWQDMAVVKIDVCKAAAQASSQSATSAAKTGEAADAPTVVSWSRAGHFVGEPIFVPRPSVSGRSSTAEDDGVVLTTVMDGEAGVSYLLILNATTMSQVARVDGPYAIPYALHGEWVTQ